MSAFDSMVIEGVSTTPAAPPASPFASMKIVGASKPQPLDEPPSFFQDVVVKSSKKLMSDAADVIDFGTVGIPSMVVAGAGEQMTRLQLTVNDLLGVGKKRTRREIAVEGAETAQRLQTGATPARNLLRTLGWLPEGPGSGEILMEKIMEPVTRAAEGIEAKTKDSAVPVLKEDVLSLVNGLFAAAGVKGAQFVGNRTVGRMEAKAAAAELKKWDAKQQVTDAAEVEAAKIGPPKPDMATADMYKAYQKATPEERAAYTPEQREAMVEFAQARREAKSRARAVFAEDPFIAGRTPRTGLREGQSLDQITPMARPVTTPGPEVFSTAEQMATQRGLQGRDLADTMARGDQGPLAAPASSLDSALAKTRRGQLFDLTPEERIALKGAGAKVVDPKIATAAIVGATGLGLALALEPSAEEAALAIGAGALIAGRGKGITLEALRTMPDATPLSRIVDQMSHTLSTIEVLAKQASNRFEFRQDTVAQLLRRDGVTGAERAILQDVLSSTPGETITAKQLMEGVKARTGDFELKRQESTSFADYGLDRIDRETDLSQQIDAEPWIPEGTVPDVEAQMRATHAAARADAARRTAEPTTTIYQSPVELGTANHFGDPNYFAHTRSFVEGGVKHVVELQSDVAQKAGKVLTEGERAALQEQFTLADRLSLAASDSYKTLTSPRSTAPELAQSVRTYIAAVPGDVQLDYKLGLGERMLKYAEGFANRVNPDPNFLALTQEMRKLDQAGRVDEIVDYGLDVLDEASKLGGKLDEAGRNLIDKSGEIQSLFEEAFSREASRMRTWRAEVKSKLDDSGRVEPVAPMLKDWHKRLVREELAAEARGRPNPEYVELRDMIKNRMRQMPEEARTTNPELVAMGERLMAIPERLPPERVVRFADADTVAKVEGWPDRQANWDRAAGQGDTGRVKVEYNRPETRFSPEHQGIYDRYAKDVTKFLKQLGGKHVKDASGHGWWEVPVEGSKATPAGKRVQQFGGIDPELAKWIAFVGGGAGTVAFLSGEDNRARNALAAASVIALGKLAISKHTGVAQAAKAAAHGTEVIFGNMSVDLRKFAPAAVRHLRDHELNSRVRTQNFLGAVEPFVKALQKMRAKDRTAVGLVVQSGRPDRVKAALTAAGRPELFPEWQKVDAALKSMGADAKSAGVLKGLLDNYFPRIIVDVEYVQKTLGGLGGDLIERKLHEANRKMMAFRGNPLTDMETSLLVNKHLEEAIRRSASSEKTSFSKQRKIAELTEELYKGYAPASEAVVMYGRGMSRAIERARFFGRNLVSDAESGLMDLDKSIGAMVAKERAAGKLSKEGLAELESILRKRFGPGEASADPITQGYKNIVNTMLLSNIYSGIRNFTDLGLSVVMHGLVPTIKAVAQGMAKLARQPVPDTYWTLKELGLINHISQEMVSGSRTPITVPKIGEISTARLAEFGLKWGSFSLPDVAGKAVGMNAAMINFMQKAQTEKGRAAIRRQYADFYGADVEQLIKDLQARKKTELTRSLVHSELSDAQPLSMMEVPQGFVQSPHTRALYTLRSWQLKQVNLLRERGFRKLVYGKDTATQIEGLGFLLRYGIFMGIAGASMQQIIGMMQGRVEEFGTAQILDNIMKTYGWSAYMTDKLRKEGSPVEKIGATLLPPYKMFDQILADDPAAVRYLPVAGAPVYYADPVARAKFYKRLEEKNKEDALSPEAKAARKKRQERAKAMYEKRLLQKYGDK